ncbi:AAA family ATPase [Youngiibacter fragilis]|uniref:Recombinase RecF n=1 Tax=Youngiibacter fragilis 232.1 TaxID=994573 RepID=V7I6S8_9CLOT|nr:ATP-binding protein [Youngiibacter fragilis]ETA81925.1 recombinase RecF [Youngiibacter fragilis 232.1]
MKINKIVLGGYRNIKGVELNLDSIIALVAVNSYGKSNVLSGISFGIEFVKATLTAKSRLMGLQSAIPINNETASDDYFIQFTMETSSNGKAYEAIYGYKFKWFKDDTSGSRIVEEWLKVRLNDKNQKFNHLISRDIKGALYKSSETGRCTNKLSIEQNELVINKLMAYDSLYYLDIIKKINNLNMYIERHLDASQSFSSNAFIRNDSDELSLNNIDSIPRLIYNMKIMHRSNYDILVDSFKTLFPNIDDILVEKVDRTDLPFLRSPEKVPFTIDSQIYLLYVIDKNLNQPLNFKYISDGSKRIFLILASLILADINNYSIIAIEEPENSVHPRLLQSYLRILSQLSNECKIVFTSHSPYIIQYLDLSNIYVGMPSKYGIANFSRLRQRAASRLIHDAIDLELSTGEYIFNLLSENDDSILDYYNEGNNG